MIVIDVNDLAAICGILGFLFAVYKYNKERVEKRNQTAFKRYVVFRLM